jgi:hypothetical protein
MSVSFVAVLRLPVSLVAGIAVVSGVAGCLAPLVAGIAGRAARGVAFSEGCTGRVEPSGFSAVDGKGRLQTVHIPAPASPRARNHTKNLRFRRRRLRSTLGQTKGGGGTSASLKRWRNNSSMLYIGRSIVQ